MYEDIITDLIIKGHYHTNDKDDFLFLMPIIDNIKWIKGEEPNCRYIYDDENIEAALSKTMKYLGEKYVALIDKDFKFGYKSMWNGTDSTSCEWHNDLIEGPNLFFLLYCNDMKKNCGGEIEFRKTDTKQVTGSILPKMYDVVIGSQKLSWEHRVAPFKCENIERIRVNFGFYVNYGFNY